MRKKRSRPSKFELLSTISAIWPEDGNCPLCDRPMVRGPTLNEHHLVPKLYGGSEKHVMHRVCHGKIHSVLTEAELAHSFHTFSALRSHPEIAKFIKWVRKQDPEFLTKHVRPSRS
jgi:hypothetical protein